MAHGQLFYSRRHHLAETVHSAQMIGIPVDLAARLLFLLIKLVFFPVERQRNSGFAGHVDPSVPGAVYRKNIARLVFQGKIVVFLYDSDFLILHMIVSRLCNSHFACVINHSTIKCCFFTDIS